MYWCNDKEQSLRAKTISRNSLKNKKLLLMQTYKTMPKTPNIQLKIHRNISSLITILYVFFFFLTCYLFYLQPSIHDPNRKFSRSKHKNLIK